MFRRLAVAGALVLAMLGVAAPASAASRSPSGASVGMSWAELESIYGRRGHLIHNDAGDPAYVVRTGARVELFTGHPIRAGAGYFQTGPANFLLPNFRHGAPC